LGTPTFELDNIETFNDFYGGLMDAPDLEPAAIAKWDPELTERLMGLIRPVIKGWHRGEVRGLEDFPPGGALVVANHSGGLFAMDVPVFVTDFYATFGYDRPVYTLSHDILFAGPTGDFFKRTGFIPASHENARSPARGWRRRGLSGWRLRRVPTVVACERNRF